MADTTFLQADLREREETDKRLSPLLLLLPVAGVLVLAVMVSLLFAVMAALETGLGAEPPEAMVVLMVVAVGVVALAPAVLPLYIVYQLVNRRDRHFRRVARLAEDATVYLRARAEEEGADLKDQLARLEELGRELRERATPRGAVLWTLLCFLVGLLPYLVLAYVLMDDYRQHERLEGELTRRLAEGFRALGTQTRLPFSAQVRARSFWLYALATLVTLGLFWVWWVYVLMVEPNRHFEAQARWEEALGALAG